MAVNSRVKCSIISLPDEVILQIFKYLDICDIFFVSHICPRLKQLASDRSLWTAPRIRFSLSRHEYEDCTYPMLRMMDCMKFVETLSLHNKASVPVDEILYLAGVKSLNLRKLSLRGQTVEDYVSIKNVLFIRRELEELTLVDTRQLLSTECGGLPKDLHICVRRLHISNCDCRLTNNILLLFLMIKNLESLSVEVIPERVGRVYCLLYCQVNSLTELCLQGTITEDLFRIICTCVRLKSLSLRIVKYPKPLPPSYPGLFSSAAWFMYVIGFSSLKFLALGGISTLQDVAIERIVDTCPLLHSCSITSCKLVTNMGIELMLLKCKNLKKLELYYMRRVDRSGLLKFMEENAITSVNVLTDEKSH